MVSIFRGCLSLSLDSPPVGRNARRDARQIYPPSPTLSLPAGYLARGQLDLTFFPFLYYFFFFPVALFRIFLVLLRHLVVRIVTECLFEFQARKQLEQPMFSII